MKLRQFEPSKTKMQNRGRHQADRGFAFGGRILSFFVYFPVRHLALFHFFPATEHG